MPEKDTTSISQAAPISIRSGPATIVASGLVTSFDGSPLSFTIGPESDSLTIIFAFIDEPQSSPQRVELDRSGDPRELRLRLINFDSLLGVGTVRPLAIGKLAGNKLYVHYRVYTHSGSREKTVQYTFYLSQVEPSGKE